MQYPVRISWLRCLLISLLLLSASASAQTQTSPDPDQVLQELFWGSLYAEGGTTLYCRESFSSNPMMITHSPVYFLQVARNHLRCGTQRNCLANYDSYRALAADMHNLFPERSRFESRRRGPRFSEVNARISEGECGERTDFGLFEPPNHAKGTVARALFHVHSRYQLPLPADITMLRQWHHDHPPSNSERQRNEVIERLQGFDNPFISDPSLADELL